MAVSYWGRVNYRDRYAGMLQQEPSGRHVFTYDSSYLAAGGPALSVTLPLQERPHVSETGLHPFFDNLVAEGWLQDAQAQALGVNPNDRFALLLGFGRDCAGAVSVIDPEPPGTPQLEPADPEALAALSSRASLSGIQPKMFVVQGARGFRPATATETSTHIAKLPSGSLPDLIALEWLTTLATAELLPGEPVVELEIAAIGDVAAEALVVRRFDRTVERGKLHFEEFNQLLGQAASQKYDAPYERMGEFIRRTPGCLPVEAERLYRRVAACLLTGNTDAHLKNFAMFHTPEGLRLTPSYDLVASAVYRQFQTIALPIAGARALQLGALAPKHIVGMGRGYGLGDRAIELAIADLGKRLPAAKEAVHGAAVGSAALREQLTTMMEKRWNGTFASTGRLLSKRRAGGGKRNV